MDWEDLKKIVITDLDYAKAEVMLASSRESWFGVVKRLQDLIYLMEDEI